MSLPITTKPATPMRVLAVLLGYGPKLGVASLFLDLARRQVRAERTAEPMRASHSCWARR